MLRLFPFSGAIPAVRYIFLLLQLFLKNNFQFGNKKDAAAIRAKNGFH